MVFKLMLFLTLVSPRLMADSGDKVLNGYDPKVDIISEEYEAGAFLIYDCEKQTFVCVLESYYKECLTKRAEAQHFKELNVRCAGVEELPNKKSCFQRQLFMVSQNMGNRFCVGTDWKVKQMDFFNN